MTKNKLLFIGNHDARGYYMHKVTYMLCLCYLVLLPIFDAEVHNEVFSQPMFMFKVRLEVGLHG